MAVVITGSISDNDFAGTGNVNANVTIPADCDLALIAIAYGNYGVTPGPTVSSITLGAVTCTLWPSSAAASTNGTDFGRAVWYYLKNPPTGASVNLLVSMTAATNGRAVVVPLKGDHPTTWQGVGVATSATSTSVATLATAAQTGGLVLDAVGAPADPLTVDASQTQLWNDVDAVGLSGGSDKAGAALVDMKWTLADSRPWAQSVVVVNPSGGPMFRGA